MRIQPQRWMQRYTSLSAACLASMIRGQSDSIHLMKQCPCAMEHKQHIQPQQHDKTTSSPPPPAPLPAAYQQQNCRYDCCGCCTVQGKSAGCRTLLLHTSTAAHRMHCAAPKQHPTGHHSYHMPNRHNNTNNTAPAITTTT